MGDCGLSPGGRRTRRGCDGLVLLAWRGTGAVTAGTGCGWWRGRRARNGATPATQRPSHQVIDPSMRDLSGCRRAFRCTIDSSSDIVLGQGWAAEGYTAVGIDPLAQGVGWLLSETGTPRQIKAAYLTDTDIRHLAAYVARLRHAEEASRQAA